MLLHNHPEYVSCACGYNAVNYDAKSLTITIFLLLPRPFLLRPVSISLGYIMDSFQTSARLFIQDGGVSARGSRQNTPALHAKTQGATRVRIEPYF